MLSRSAGELVFTMLTVLLLVPAIVGFSPASFGFHRLHGTAYATRDYDEGMAAEAKRRLVEVTVAPGLCGPSNEGTSLQSLYDYYGLMPELLPLAIQINHNANPQNRDDVKHHAEKVFRDQTKLVIPLTPEPLKREGERE